MKTKSKPIRKILSILLTGCFIFSLSVEHTYGAWDDKSDELPGMDNSGTTAVLVAGGIVLTGLITYLIIKSAKKKKLETDAGYLPENNGLNIRNTQSPDFAEKLDQAKKELPFEVYVDMGNSIKYNQGVSVGLRFSF